MSSYLTFCHFDLLQYRQPCQPLEHTFYTADNAQTQNLHQCYFIEEVNVCPVLFIHCRVSSRPCGVWEIPLFSTEEASLLETCIDFHLPCKIPLNDEQKLDRQCVCVGTVNIQQSSKYFIVAEKTHWWLCNGRK